MLQNFAMMSIYCFDGLDSLPCSPGSVRSTNCPSHLDPFFPDRLPEPPAADPGPLERLGSNKNLWSLRTNLQSPKGCTPYLYTTGDRPRSCQYGPEATG